MIGIVFLLLLGWQFYIGYTRGIILQAYYTLAGVVSLVVANSFYLRLADALTLWVPFVNPTHDAKVSFFTDVTVFELDRVYYAGVAFLTVYILSYLAFRLLGIFLHVINLDKYDSSLYNSISGGLSVLMTILIFSMGTTILATLPVTAIQSFLAGHVTTKVLIHFPIFAQLWHYFWVTKIL